MKHSSQLTNLKNEIDKTLASLGYPSDNKAFQPHLTIGRFAPGQKDSTLLENTLNKWQSTDQFEYTAREIVLFESKQTQAGVKYYPIETFPLATEKTKK
ncbi:MAG: 2'-5' RNA ligase family protein [Paludibacter sp.]